MENKLNRLSASTEIDSLIFSRFFLDTLRDGSGRHAGMGASAHQVSGVEEVSEKEEVRSVHQRAVLQIIPRLTAEITSCLHLKQSIPTNISFSDLKENKAVTVKKNHKRRERKFQAPTL